MGKKLVEEFSKKTKTHEIKLIAGIDPNPPDPYPNAIFYIRMESTHRKTEETTKVKPIWFSLNEMMKLSVLMALALRFWTERLNKDSPYSHKRIEAFIDTWTQMKDSMESLLESRT